MFAMTSMGVNVINYINHGCGPYVFKISGQLCYRIGSLIPNYDARSEYCQLYIFDTDNEVRNRIVVVTSSNSDFQPSEAIVASSITMLDAHNSVVQVFRKAHDRLSMQPNNQSDELNDRYVVKLFSIPSQHGNIYSDPVASEVVGLVVNDLGTTEEGCDLIVQEHSSAPKSKRGTWQIYGNENIKYRRYSRSDKIKRKVTTMAKYFSYRLHDRAYDFNTPLRSKRLTQDYEVDAYCCVEDDRLRYYRKKSFKKKYRSSPYKALVEAVSSGITTGSAAGQRI